MRILLACATLAVTMGSGDATAADEAAKVLECMQGNVPTSLRVQEVEFSTSDRSGPASTLKGRLYAARELAPDGSRLVRAMLHLSAPPNLSGAAYLIREKDGDLRDGMYVYLPSVKRVRGLPLQRRQRPGFLPRHVPCSSEPTTADRVSAR